MNKNNKMKWNSTGNTELKIIIKEQKIKYNFICFSLTYIYIYIFI